MGAAVGAAVGATLGLDLDLLPGRGLLDLSLVLVCFLGGWQPVSKPKYIEKEKRSLERTETRIQKAMLSIFRGQDSQTSGYCNGSCAQTSL